ncbi:MAG: class I SAM-dependent methyltransferase [Crocinitomicaceae bacterium]|nr:class I SAM-dependent methyltransferase [Crocinitomicaceae bacterium]
MKEFWDERYGAEEWAYGKEANEFLKESISSLTPGTALFPAEGEGRNAVYAASLGWEVSAFDQSVSGRKKALELAIEKKVRLDYQVANFDEIDYPDNYFDLIVLIFVHFPPAVRPKYHENLLHYLKPGGKIILEGFSKKHLEYSKANPKAGGPPNIDFLFSIEEMKSDFQDLDIQVLEEIEVEMNEGLYHVGKSSVIRLIGTKKK